MNPADRLYSDQHLWLMTRDGLAIIGLTDHAQDKLGRVEYLDFPPVGKHIAKGDEMCALESSKAAMGIASPIAGRLAAVNEALRKTPAVVNSDPYGQGWLCKLEPTDASELASLMSAAEYDSLVGL